MTSSTSRVAALASVFIAFTALVSAGVVFGAAYQPCSVPPVVGAATKPNVMIVMDYSGSMQFPAYYFDHDAQGWGTTCWGYCSSKVADTYHSDTTQIYVPANQYYGTFESDVYYKYDGTEGHDYFYPADPQPVETYTGIAESADGGGGTIQFTAEGHDFQVGDLVAFYDLTSHKSLNAQGHTVVSVSGDTFKINHTWNGKPDSKGYKVIKRIPGNTTVGISGNILNLAVTSRIDAALKALIGGKATTVSGDTDNVYLQNQGSRTYVSESTNVHADFYVRPATLSSPAQAYPDNYSSGTYTDKDIFVTIFGKYEGSIDSNDPTIGSVSYEPWTFTLTRTTYVEIKLQGTWSNWKGSRIYICSDSNFSSYVDSSYKTNSNTTTFSKNLSAGTYYVAVGPYSQPSSLSDSYTLRSSADLSKSGDSESHNGTAVTKIGAIPWARVRVKVPAEERRGLIDESFDFVRFGFMFYNSDNKGKILVGCNNTDIDLLRNAMEGKEVNGTTAFPYNGTPTGEAMEEALDYYKQSNGHWNASNDDFIDDKSLTDPYYSPDASGTAQPVPCRKSFVLLISDGEWNGSDDPAGVARTLHTSDLRTATEFDGDQVANVYSIFAFSQDQEGENSMKAVAMYGNFNELTVSGAACGTATFPYPQTTVPKSLNFTWPVSVCNPSGTYNECCKEWDSVWDRDGADDKGIPDAYFGASNGAQLEAALKSVFADVAARNASASAVATVSQELSSGDIIIRGVFEAVDPDRVDTYLWRGHLEAYRPFEHEYEEVYDFELDCNADRLCLDMPGGESPCPSVGSHCWDSGSILSGTTPSTRTVFTGSYNTSLSKWENRTFVSGTASPAITKTDLEVADDATAAALVSWVRGDSVAALRDRQGWLLGDIVYSTPVVVGPPRLGDVSTRDPNIEQFLAFRNDHIHRDKIIYVGANDGMLHAFLMGTYDEVNDKWIYDPAENSNIGKELWAYIPTNLLTELKDLADSTYGQGGCSHRTTVDLSPRSWEVYIKSDDCDSADSQGRCWRSVIVGGERGGGDVYFAVDITDPHDPKLLWEYSVLKNRVVAELTPCPDPDPTDQETCIQECHAQCAAGCETARQQCIIDKNCSSKRWWERRRCENECQQQENLCVDACNEDDCSTECPVDQGDTEFRAFVPFRDAYESIKILPMTWSQPYLGRIKIPTSVKFYYGDPTPFDTDACTGGQPDDTKVLQFDADNNVRSVVFMSGGLHLFDKDFDTTPEVDIRYKEALFMPHLIMMDIETGHNLFEYVWPKVLLRAQDSTVCPTCFQFIDHGGNAIPYAMSDPVALDVWNQELDIIGDDGFIDRVYVGDMNGNFYGIKFNLDPVLASGTNTNFGALVEIWPTKSTMGDDSNLFRGDRQPITLAPAATFESDSEYVQVIFGAGKYDDVTTGTDDKTDIVKTSLYNIRDKVELPDLSSSDAYEVYDDSHKTNFKILFQKNCDEVEWHPDPDVEGDRQCTWATLAEVTDESVQTTVCSDPDDLSTCSKISKLASSSDCCERDNSTCTDPCYECIYDFELPETDGLPGERVVGKPLIAGGIIFVTTYVPPNDLCGYTGEAYLYVFGVDCVPLTDPANIVPSRGGTAVGPVHSSGGTASAGVRVGLGSGVPSKPVLDSRGENVIVQMSDGTLERIGVNLPQKPVKARGWRAR